MPVGEGADVNPPLSWKSSKSGTEVSTVTGLVASIPFSSMNLTLISSFIKTFLLRIIHLIYSVVGKCPAVKLVNLNRTGGKILSDFKRSETVFIKNYFLEKLYEGTEA